MKIFYRENLKPYGMSVKGDVIEVNPYAIQLFHRVKCMWFKGQIQAAEFIRGQHL